jgi:hypothetical protein
MQGFLAASKATLGIHCLLSKEGLLPPSLGTGRCKPLLIAGQPLRDLGIRQETSEANKLLDESQAATVAKQDGVCRILIVQNEVSRSS